jgi:hypothetical protein
MSNPNTVPCTSCNGTGRINGGWCIDCHGLGRVHPNTPMPSFSYYFRRDITISYNYQYQGFVDTYDEAIERMAQQLADEIDNEVLNEIINNS